MKSATIAGVLASVLYSQQAVATTYGWNDAQSFSSPENCNNTCSSDQTGGFNWGNVPTGPINNFDGFGFSGFNCENSFSVRMGKRGLVRRTQFAGKAIVAKATTDDATCPKMTGQNKDFSITEMHVSVDKDSQLTFEYGMPDGSTCRQQSQCSVEGSVIKNTQCGGAQQVKVKGDCNFGFHSIIFDCQPGTSSSSSSSSSSTTTTPVTTSTSSTTTTTACAETETTNQQGSCVPKTTVSTTTPATTPSTTTPASTTPTTTTTPVCAETESKNDQGSCVPKTTPSTTIPTTTAVTTSTPASTTPSTTPATTTATCSEGYVQSSGSCVPQTPTGGSCATTETLIGGKCVPLTTNVSPTAPTCGAGQTFSGTGCVPLTITTTPASSDLVTTEIVVTTLTSCPVTVTSGTVTSISLTLSTTFITSTVTFCPKCGESPPSTIGTTTVNAPPPPTTPACSEGSELQNGSCVPKTPTGGTAPPSTSTPAATTSCQSTESFSNGSCVPKTPTGGSGTPTPTPPVCNGDQEVQNGQCVPKPPTGNSPPPAPPTSSAPPAPPTTSAPPTPPTTSAPPAPPTTSAPSSVPFSSWTIVSSSAQPVCQEGQVQSNGQCVPQTPTGGVTSSSTTVNAPPPGTPVPEAPCPSVLPRCLSTWMSQAGSCSSNSDISCFCPSPNFIASVQECVSAWSGDDAQVQAALSYLVGICAKFVPQNPGICTGVPSTITLVPTPSAPAQAPPTGSNNAPVPTAPPFTGNMPSTVITFTQTITSGSTVTQTVTVPQVVFNTVTQQVTLPGANGQPAQTQAQGVGLVPALPLTTPPAGPGGAPPAGSGPVAGQTGASTFIPSSTTGGYSGSQTGGNTPIQTFTGSATKTGYGLAAGIFGLIAFLA